RMGRGGCQRRESSALDRTGTSLYEPAPENRIEISISRQDVTLALFGQHGDEAVDRRPHRHPAPPKEPIDVGGPYVSVDPPRLEKQQLSKETLDLDAALRPPEPLENFGHHDSAGANLVVPGDQTGESPLLSRRESIEEVGPDRRVDENPQA